MTWQYVASVRTRVTFLALDLHDSFKQLRNLPCAKCS
jgi:hypothetical protein